MRRSDQEQLRQEAISWVARKLATRQPLLRRIALHVIQQALQDPKLAREILTPTTTREETKDVHSNHPHP
jgi:hypothetical protein